MFNVRCFFFAVPKLLANESQAQSNLVKPNPTTPPPPGKEIGKEIGKETVKFLAIFDHMSVRAAGSDLALGISICAPYPTLMALVRILIDGYSLLHNWPELAPGKARHSAAARDELIHIMTQYRDAIGTPITIFFDGAGAPVGTPAAISSPELEVLYSKSGQTADEMIERAAYRFADYGEVLAVTDDLAERDTVISLGGSASSCLSFIQSVESTLAELADDIKDHNRRERHKFQRRR